MKFKEEILNKFMIRKSKKEKTLFIDWVKEQFSDKGYDIKIEKGFGTRNIVIGDVSKAKVIFTAHYDTCANMYLPNFITPTNMGIYFLYQLLICIILFLIPSVICFILGLVIPGFISWSLTVFDIILLLLFYLIMFGPANKNTVNDNTSGVLTILNIMSELPEKLKDSVCFVLFDCEELGLLGSSDFASKHKEELKNKLLVNFDCVSDGDKMLFVLNKKTKEYQKLFEDTYKSDDKVITNVVTKGVFYPSDQICVPCGVGVCSVIRGKNFDYIDKIHTKNDTVLREENIKYLSDKSIELVKNMK